MAEFMAKGRSRASKAKALAPADIGGTGLVRRRFRREPKKSIRKSGRLFYHFSKKVERTWRKWLTKRYNQHVGCHCLADAWLESKHRVADLYYNINSVLARLVRLI